MNQTSKSQCTHKAMRQGALQDIYNAIFEKISLCEPGATPEQLAHAATIGVKDKLGGQSIYVPMDRAEKIRGRQSEIYDLWKSNNATIQEISLTFDISQSLVYEIIAKASKESGCTETGLRDLRRERNERLYEAWKNGVTTSQLVKDFGLTQSGVQYIIRRLSTNSQKVKP